MRRSAFPLYVLLGALLAGSALSGQQPAPTAAPAGAPQAPAGGRGGRGGGAVRSPEVLADGRVTFRLRAPNAKEVAVNVAGNTLPMQKDEQGVWSATSSVLAPNYYTYSLVVDGTSINDPNNRQVQTSFTGFQSMFVVPGPNRGSRHPMFPAAPSRVIASIRPSPTTTATSSSTRRLATTRGVARPIPCSISCTDSATMRSGG